MKRLAAVGLVAIAVLAGSALPAGAQGGSRPVITPGNAAQVTRLGVMDCETGQLPISVAFSPDGSQLAYGCSSGPVHLWDLNFNVELATIPASHSLALAFNPDGSRLATGGYTGDPCCVIEVWNAATGELVNTLAGHSSEPRALAFSPDGTLLLSGGNDGSVRLWHAGFGRQLAVLHDGESEVRPVMFSPDSTLAAAVSGGQLYVWNVTTTELVNVYGPSSLQTAAFMPDGTLIGGWATLYQFSAGAERQVAILSDSMMNAPLFSGDVFNPARSLMVGHFCDTQRDCRVMLFDTATGQEVARLYAHTESIGQFAFSPDGTRFASASFDGTVWLWGVR
ncbi:MAG: WD40 repeat domain-containing protein [Anaerolineae bacterium]|nr:WD40 repeat domain-containing protein [Anaerolineae bacterium]